VRAGSAIPPGEQSPSIAGADPQMRPWIEAGARLPLGRPDAADEGTLNRILWHAAKGAEARCPAELAGAHGRGLAALGLWLGPAGLVEEDD
jgi:hypothetical protein